MKLIVSIQMGVWCRVKNVLIGVAIGRTVIDTFGSVARVDGISMQPTFNPNTTVDFVFLSYIPDMIIYNGYIKLYYGYTKIF